MKLSIVIPALNEELAIAAIIERCLAAREVIAANSPADDVEIIVVSDGSTDRTARIAAGYPEVRLIVFETNRGYGAAVKEGFARSSGELVGFLDADGTCDPAFFAVLCNALVEENGAMAIGSRMGPDSKMPRLRRFGNRVYALILSVLSNRVVTDAASGMRVIRRDALTRLYPLPNGLHFTPAMSARVLMDDHLTLIERPMPYQERIGESKLRVWQDGARFLHVILEMSLLWRPARLFCLSAGGMLSWMILLAMHPLEMWVRHGHLQEDMIYRLLFCSLLGTLGAALLSAGVIGVHLQRLFNDHRRTRSFFVTLLDRAYTLRVVVLLAVPVGLLLTWLVGYGIWTRITEGYIDLHWSRVLLAGLIFFGWGQMLITVMIVNVLRFHSARRSMTAALQSSREVARGVRRANHSSSAVVELPVVRTGGPYEEAT